MPAKKKTETVKQTINGDTVPPETTAETAPPAGGEAPEAAPVVKRAKVGRGSTRRIVRAFTDWEAATKAFIDEMDAQTFVADDDGSRCGSSPIVLGMRDALEDTRHEVNDILANATAS